MQQAIRAGFEPAFLGQAARHDDDHLAQDGVVSHLFGRGGHLTVDQAGAAFDGVARFDGHRPGFAGQRRFVQAGATGCHTAVRRDDFVGFDGEPVSGGQLADGHVATRGRGRGDQAHLGGLQVKKSVQVTAHALFGALFQKFAQEHQRDQHAGRVEIEVDAAGQPVVEAVSVGTAGPGADQCLHARCAMHQTEPGFAQHGAGAVDHDQRCHEHDGQGQLGYRILVQRGEKAGVKGPREHHHIGGEQARDDQPNERLAMGGFCHCARFGHVRGISQPLDGFADMAGGQPIRTIAAVQPIR